MTEAVDAEVVDEPPQARCLLCERTSSDPGVAGKQCRDGTPPCRGRMIAIPGAAVPAQRSVAVSDGLVLPAAVQKRLDRAAELYDERAAEIARHDPDSRRDPRAAAYHRQARAESTRRAYLGWIRLWLHFCETTGRRERPAHAATLESFAVFLCNHPIARGKNKGAAGYSPNSIRQAMSAVRTYHRLMGENPPDSMLALGVIEGYARTRKRVDPTNTDGQGVPGLRLPSLKRMFEVCDVSTNAGARDRAVLSLGWAMMARRSELAGLDVRDVELTEDGVKVHVRWSKTDQVGVGRTVPISWKPELGELCPVVCVTRWSEVLGQLGIVDGGFFRGVDRHDRINGQPGWAGPNSVRMDPMAVELIIARAAVRASVPDAAKLRGHSLRRGGATDFYEAGADILAIARQGGWGERSPVIFRYIEDVDRWKTNPLAVADFDDERPRKAQRRNR